MSGRRTDIDLSGRWMGFFNYPVARPPVSFEASLHDSGGVITGVTTEPSDVPGGLARTVSATIDGRREGSSVTFVKVYDQFDGHYDLVHYQGAVQAGRDEIEGRWEIPGNWGGTFLMVRASGTSEEIELEVEDPVGREL